MKSEFADYPKQEQRQAYTHGRKNNGKVVLMVINDTLYTVQFHQTSLATDHGSNLGGGGTSNEVSYML